jgi:hypothetical protein
LRQFLRLVSRHGAPGTPRIEKAHPTVANDEPGEVILVPRPDRTDVVDSHGAAFLGGRRQFVVELSRSSRFAMGSALNSSFPVRRWIVDQTRTSEQALVMLKERRRGPNPKSESATDAHQRRQAPHDTLGPDGETDKTPLKFLSIVQAHFVSVSPSAGTELALW